MKRSIGNAFRGMLGVAMLALTATFPNGVWGAPVSNTWTGGGLTNLWSEGVNWSAGVPVDGQDVTINSGSVTLTEATAELASFTLAKGATLNVEGWESALTATNLTIAGTVTHAAQTVTEPDPVSGEWIPQHRIWLKGSNLVVTANGVLDADYVGYLPGAGPGRSIDDVQGGGGGSYGGHGGSGYGGTFWGPVYGDAADPWQPGSGGGAYSASRPAGGAIRVELDGALVIDGTVSARGQNGVSLRGTSGSGGGVLLQCRTVQGAGIVRADGGVAHGYSGSGGGGRIAMHYNLDAQAALPVPRPALRFSAMARYGSAEMTVWPEMGTLYLPDMTLLASAPEADVVLANQRFWHVRLILGSHPTSWYPASLTITNCVVGFVEGFELHVGGNLKMQGITGVSTPLAGALQAGLRLYAAASENLYGTRLTVAGDFVIGSDAWFYPHTSGTNAAIVGVEVGRDLIVTAGGGIDADRAGYMPQVDNLNGPGAGLNNESGGSYGGHGGGASYRPAYGLAALPLDLGSPGGWRDYGASYTPSGSGGGAIHVLAGRNIVIDGLLSANGTSGQTYRGPGGSGGSIFLAAARRVSGSGTLQANGGAGNLSRAPGGGGRIAIWRFLPLDTVKQRIAAHDVRSLQSQATSPDFSGTLTVDVSPSTTAGYSQADPGTKAFYSHDYTLILLR